MTYYYKTHLSDAVNAICSDPYTLEGEPTNETDFKAKLKVVKSLDKDDNPTYKDPSEWGFTWAQVKAEWDKNLAADDLRLLRLERNDKLAETDWWAGSDLTMTEAQKKYRKDLRDLPANTSDPSNPTWPTKPGG